MSAPLRVLCLDIEGGYGGSSRSLFELVRHLDRTQVDAEVWCRKAGPIQPRYESLGVPVRVTPAMPRVSSLPLLSRNLYVYGLAIRDFLASGGFRRELVRAAAARFDLVHFNHEALFLLARWLRPRTRAALTMHIRTNLHDTPFARWQDRIVARTLDRLIYITDNERRTLERLSGCRPQGKVIHNPVAEPGPVEPYCRIPKDGRLKIACLSNYSWYRGIDRLVDVAQALAARGRRDVLFVIGGDMSLTRSLPGELGAVARQGGTLADFAARRGVAEMFLFLGHVDAPERVLAGCDLLAKPTREDNPWGRDVIEALAMRRPVLSVGADCTFVETGVTGLLQPKFDAEELAASLIRLADDRALCARWGAAAEERVRRLCHGPSRAAEILGVWREAVAARA